MKSNSRVREMKERRMDREKEEREKVRESQRNPGAGGGERGGCRVS